MEMQGKNVVYVGGFGGIGFATCKLLIQKKVANLFVIDLVLNEPLMKELKALGASSGTQVNFEQLDLCKKEQIPEVLKKIIAQISYIDILVNGSGMINDHKPEQTMGVNLMGLIYTTLAAIPYMDKSNGGRGGMIVNIASVLGLEPCSCLAIYTASKHGVMGFTRSIADEFYYEKTGIAVMAICPGITMTGLWHEFDGNDTFPYSTQLSKKFFSAEHQSAEECAVNFVKAMETGKNDSIWILDLGKLEEVKPKVYWTTTHNN
ncbi:alcohol dehydrogenase-like [Eupeodes corollae]|uniref:alcohol dehydrogenase-like n=1 Tax=Eupeodes corollae TaxID=290404 RepID=UPI0024912ED6|nr:alcohol dehydrogenase-like [Eupeodes corollae]